MKNNYKLVCIYYDILIGKVYFVPTGENIMLGGTTGINFITEIDFPCEKDKLYKAVENALNNCYKEKVYEIPKVSLLKNYLGKGYSKANKTIKSFNLEWTKEKGYFFMPTRKEKNGYFHIPEQVIILGKDLNQDILYDSFNKVIQISTI